MSRLRSRILLACVCGMALACRHAPPSIPDQARLYAGVGRCHRVVSTGCTRGGDQVYRDDLLRQPNDARALAGFEQALRRHVKRGDSRYCATVA